MGTTHGLNRSDGGIIPANAIDQEITTRLISEYILTPLKHIRKYISDKAGIRSSHCYELLIVIKHHPRSSEFHIRELMNSSRSATKKNIGYLVDLGLVKPIGKPRLIIPFNRFKVDTAYLITAKGVNVIGKIMNGE